MALIMLRRGLARNDGFNDVRATKAILSRDNFCSLEIVTIIILYYFLGGICLDSYYEIIFFVCFHPQNVNSSDSSHRITLSGWMNSCIQFLH